MKFHLIFCCLVFIGCTSPTSNKTTNNEKIVYATFGSNPIDDTKERKFTLMEREIKYLIELWQGDFDNVEQLSLEKDIGRKDILSGQHLRIHSKIRRVINSNLGEFVLYLEETQNNNHLNIFKQHIYVLQPIDSIASIKVEVYDIRNGGELIGVSGAPEKLSKLKASSFLRRTESDLLIQREGYSFFSKSIRGQHAKTPAEDLPDYQVRIAKDEYWFRYSASNENDDGREGWFMLDKARCFVCMIDFPREEGGRPVDTRHYIDIHDQGGQFEFDYLDGRHMVLTMRNTWSYGMQRNTFVIVLQENDLTGPTLIYAWGEDGADRIGMNPGWIRVQCDIKNDQNIIFQQELRPDS